MFAATITLTINAVAKVLNRVNQDSYGSEYLYSSALESITMKIRHTTDSVDADGVIAKRHNVYVEWTVFPTGVDAIKKFTYTGTLRHGKFNDPIASADLAKAVNVWIAASTNAVDLASGVN